MCCLHVYVCARMSVVLVRVVCACMYVCVCVFVYMCVWVGGYNVCM